MPILDGEPSYPFGKDKNHPALLAHEAKFPTIKTASPEAVQGALI